MYSSNNVVVLNAGIMGNEDYNPTEVEEMGACINEKKLELEALHERLEELEDVSDLDVTVDIYDLHQEIHTLEGEIEIDEGELTDLYDQE